MIIRKVKISEIKVNPNNPRVIKDDRFKKLVQSVKDFPEMLEIRPIVVNGDMVVLGGNMRLKACKEAGIKEVPIIIAGNLTEEQQREVTLPNALKAFKTAPKEGKVTDRIKTFEDACEEVGISENVKILLTYNGVDEHMLGAQALAKLSIIHEALNEGWVADYSDGNQKKYYSWFEYQEVSGGGGSLVYDVFDYYCSLAYVGARLSFKSSELAEYAGKQFQDIYNQFLTLNS